MKSLFCFFRRVCFIALLLISLTSPQATFANDLIVPHGTLASQLGAPSYQLSTDWQGFNVLGIAVQVNLGGDIGGTAANVSMSGSGHLQYSQYPGNANLTFSGGAGTATMDIGFETWAKYRIAFAGFHGEGNLPLLPDIANTDLRFADQQPFNSYMLGSTVTLSDTVDDVQIVSVPAIDSVEFDLPPGLFDISIGISITPSLTCKLKGTRLDTGEGFFYSPGDALNVYLNAPSLTVSDIVQTTHCDFIAGIMPNGTIEVTAFGLWDHTGTLPTGLNISLPIASADISTTPSQNVTFNLQTSAPVITTVSPATLLTSGSPQPIKIIGSGFTGSSTLLFNGSIASDPARLTYINANEIDYNVIVPSAGNWTVQVVNGAQTSNSKSFTVNAPTANTGSLVVNLSPVGATSAGAQWQVNGIFHNSGDVVPSLAPGQYTVTFKSVSGYTTPASQQVTVTANAQATVNASYSTILPSTYSLTLNYNNTQGGASASPLAAGNAYTAGAVVQLYASPSFGYHFTGWSGDASGTANPLTITMNGSKNITANFASGDPNLGTITVTIQPPGAATAGVTWGFNANDFRNSGTSYTGYPETVILTLHTVDGWIGPPVLFATFTAGQTTNYNVTFTADTTPGLLTVTLSPPDAVTAGAKWHVNDGAAQGNGATVPLAPGNGYNITFDAVSGWTAPTTQSVQVQRGQTTVVTGNYGPPTGQPLIGEISPPIGPMTGGTLLSLNGVNFTSPATVTIGGQQASNVTISSSSQITCVTPPNSLYGSSPVVVHTPTGNATNLNGFAYGASLGSKIDLVSSIGGRNYAVAVQGNYAYVGEGCDLLVLDVSVPSSPSRIGRVALPGIVEDIALFGQYAYIADNDAGLQVVDISNPVAPTIRGVYSTNNFSHGIAILGGRAYVADEIGGLEIFDLGNPTLPALLSSTNCGPAEDVVVRATANGVYAYLSTGGNLCVVDVSQPQSPILLGQTPVGGDTLSLTLSGNYIFAPSFDDGILRVMDVSNPNAPLKIGQAPNIFDATAVGVVNNTVYAISSIDSFGFYAFSFSGGTLSLVGHTTGVSASGKNMVISGNRAFISGGTSGFKVVDVSNPSLPSSIASFTDSGAFGDYNSVALSGDVLCADVSSGSGLGDFKVFDVSQPGLPTLVGQLSGIGLGRQVLAKNGVAYLIGNGVNDANASTRIISIANPHSPQLLATIPDTTIFNLKMALAGNSLYVVGQNTSSQPRFVAVDVSNPSSPIIHGTKDYSAFQAGSIAFSVACGGSKALVGIQPAAGAPDYLSILDISNINAPVEVGSISSFGYPVDMRISSDGHYAYVLDGNANAVLRVLDISNPSSPLVLTNIPLDISFGRRLEMQGGELFASTYKKLYVFDLSNPSLPFLTRTYADGGTYGIAVSTESPNQNGMIYLANLDGGAVFVKEQDIQAPTTFITNPTFSSVYTNSSSVLNLGGSADDNLGIARMSWANNRGGAGVINAPFDNWFVSGITLFPGTNVLTVTAFDAAGNSGNDALTVIYPTTNQNQTITFLSITDHTFGDAPIPLVAAASSGLPVAFSVVSGSASVSNNVLTLTGAGAVTIQASQSGNASYNPATPVDVSFNVARANQTIAFDPISNHAASDAPFALTARTSSGLPVYFNVISGPATASSNIVTLLGGGLASVIASQPGNSNYNAAATVQQTFNVGKIPQTITLGALSQQKAGDAPFSVNAAASSGLPVSLSLVSGPAMLSGNFITLTGFGTVSLSASQPGDNTYSAAPNVTQSFFVSPPDNTIANSLLLPNGSFQFAFYGTVGSNYTLQVSTNLTSWSSPFTFTCSNSPTIVTDTNAMSGGRKFYRLKQ